MTIMAEGYCLGCGQRLVRAGARTGDEHSRTCEAHVIVERAWSVPSKRPETAYQGIGALDVGTSGRHRSMHRSSAPR